LPQNQEEGHATQKCLLFTFVFQAFVFMQIFNQINARKLEEGEINVFSGMFRNWLFIAITVFTFVIQMSMVEYGGVAVKAYPLNTHQNMICLAFGALELLVGLLIKFVPLRFFQCISLDETPASDVQGASLSAILKKSSTIVKK
jgi:Ca2+ transporting ATPase